MRGGSILDTDGNNGMRERVVKIYYAVIGKAVRPLANSSLSPNTLTLLSLLVSLGVFFLFAGGCFFLGGLALLLSGLFDTMDGTVARLEGRATRFGALLDSSADRLADFFIFAGLLVYFRQGPTFYGLLMALAGSYLVSYVKARAESLGTIRVVGFMQRPERILLLAAASLSVPLTAAWFPGYSEVPLVTVIWFMAVATNITAVHRLLAARRDLDDSSRLAG